MSRKSAFLVNFWLEPEEDDGVAAWRGSVEHLASGKRLYFNEIASLVAFLFRWMHAPESRSADIREI